MRTFLKVAVVAGALAYLVGSGRLSPGDLRLGAPGAVALLACMVALTCVRYWLLLRGAGIRLRFRDACRVNLIGLFFNTFMPGGAGGDLVRMGYVHRYAGDGAGAVASTLVDRCFGLLGVLALSGTALAIGWGRVRGDPALRALAVVVFSVLATAGVHGFFLLFVFSRRPDGRLASRVRRLPLGDKVVALVDALLAYRGSLPLLAGAFALSVALHACNLGAVHLLGGGGAPMEHVFFAWPAAFVVNALPVPGGGLGVGEAAYDHLLALCGTAGGAPVFFAWRCWLVAFGLLGLPLYLMRGRQASASASTFAT